MNRRSLLRGAAALATAATVPGLWVPEASAQGRRTLAARRRIPTTLIGQQWFMIRDALAEDFEGTWAAVAAMGIRHVELGPPLFGRTAEEMRDLFSGLGMHVVSRMLPLSTIRGDFDAALQECRTLGVRYVRCNIVSAEQISTRAGIQELAEIFDHAGWQARRMGMQFGHHNHDQEFTPIEGGIVPMELLLELTDPRAFDVQLDVYWAIYAGADVIAFLNEYGDRIGTFHLKDMNPDGSQTDVGAGIIDWPAVFAAGPPHGRRQMIFDLDNPEDPLQSVANSLAYLQQLTY